MTITYGTIGTNWITESWIQAANKTGQWELKAVYSRTKEQAEKFASRYGCTHIHTSLEELAHDSKLQVIYIASPNSLHYEQAKQMLRAKKHVLLEKPATSTVAELDDLFRIAKEEGVYLIEAYRHIQEANYKLLRKLVDEEKRLGQIYGASITYCSYSSRYNNVLNGEEPNIFSLKFSGGSLVDVGVYPVTFVVALFGKPKSQSYIPMKCRTGVDGGGVGILEYDGFGVQINNSKCYQSTAPCEVYGEKGTLTLNSTTDIDTLKHWSPQTKKSEELAGPCKRVEKPNVNMEEEAAEFARILNNHDTSALQELETISRNVLHVTSEMRRQAGIVYPADKST
ncbi:Putative gfo/Idh/MocA-like oxidoreductase, NAD(P)-binding domain superfamily [Septoria linicola]|uniref:Gfo/Idh/MocA-like oxidoreductase, NAD(P)-binding domain superfamily n=1 Tax=Septoria linicola TaxID=215465 RepID=A0A9Q9B2Z7_9PEZI|nr:Putative gfo/Idh/MocA-like oxidoreductase, NAD(P)-binding domain superfamily [Septoria linicola]